MSRSTEESTSIERQREVIEEWASRTDHVIIGWAVDDGVSGSVDPFATPELGPWLRDRAPEFDVIAVWKLDRLGRSAIQLNKLFGWCEDYDKTLVSCSENIDLTQASGRLIANVIGYLAEGELDAIRERQVASRRKLREVGRWPGGKPPFGYRAVKRDGGGYALEVDPVSSKVVKQIVRDVLDGTPVTRVANELNSRGYRPPAAYYVSQKAGEPSSEWSKGERPSGSWSTTAVRNMLRSKALRGYAHHDGETVRDDDGMPVQLAEPLVTFDEWEQIQAILDRVQKSRRGIKRTKASPLSGVVLCWVCERPLHHDLNTVKRAQKVYRYRYYKCTERCAPMVPAEIVEELAEQQFLMELGDVEVQERVWVPGESHEIELREALASMDELATAMGKAKSSAGRQRLQRQIEAVDARIVELEAAPAREARWEFKPTGDTYEAVWNRSSTDERRELLLKSGITITAAYKPLRFHIRVPAEIERLSNTP